MTRGIHYLYVVSNAAIALHFISASPAAAQTQQAALPARADEQIIVTAQRRSERIDRVPMAITAVRGERLEQLGVKTTPDLAKIVPGFVYAQSFSSAPIYSLRGVGLNEATLAASPAVSVYVDEVPLPFSVMTRGASLDLERVEVLKGPQGTLYGQNSTGGAINYIAARPTDHLTWGTDWSFSRFATADVQAFISGPVGSNVKARLAVQSTQGGDWQRSQTRPDDTLGQTDFSQARLLVDWQTTSNLRFSVSLNGWRDRSDSQAAQLSAVTPIYPMPFIPPAMLNAQPVTSNSNRLADWTPGIDYRNNDWFYQGALRGDWDVTSDVVLTSISAYEKYHQQDRRDLDGIAVNYAEVPGHIETVSQELRLTAHPAAAVRMIVGGNYQRDKAFDSNRLFSTDTTFIRFFSGALGAPPLDAIFVNARQHIRSYAAFANLDYRITDTLSAEAGARYTDSLAHFESCSLDSGNGNAAGVFTLLQTVLLGHPASDHPEPGGCTSLNPVTLLPELFRGRLHENNVSWRAGLKYEPRSGTMFYANASRGYKSGIFPTVLATSSAQFAPARQEQLTAYDLGTKLRLLHNLADISGAIYYYDYKDKQLRGRIIDPVFGSLEKLVNAPAHVKGAEVQANFRPTPAFTLALSGSYVDSRLKHFVGYDESGVLTDFSGSRTPFAPKWQAFADTEYRHALSDRLEGFVGASVSYTSRSSAFLGGPDMTFTDVNGHVVTEPLGLLRAHTLTDVRLGLRNAERGWSVYVWGRNVFNVGYATFAVHAADTATRYTGRPATFGLTFSFKSR